jgi:diguanylate cyclase (GGDEF)-like protein
MIIMTTDSDLPDENERILIVDDTPANLRMLKRILGGQGYTVHLAPNGESALRFLESMLPSIILLDIVMPGMNGYQLCERLKASARTREIPVIFVSAADNEVDKVRAFAAGGIDYIVRPLQPEELLARIKTHLSLRSLQKRLEQLVQQRTSELMKRTAELTDRTAELIEANIRLQQENAERRQAEKHVLYMAHFDALTGLPNRVLLLDRIEQAVASARRNRTQVAIFFIDIDHFKHINDSLGHQVGDQILRMIATRLQECLRKGDTVARLGGDEFVLSLPLQHSSSDITTIAQKVLDVLDKPFVIEGHELSISASIGISVYPNDGSDKDSLMRAADAAMYHAKERGRGSFQFFTPELDRAAQQRLEMGNRLRRALGQNEFMLYYQPQVDIETGTIFSAEALLRFLQPDGLPPASCADFIAIAEETGLILPIGEWVLRQACEQLRKWQDAGYPHLRIAVNLSSRQFSQVNFISTIQRILDETGVSATALDLEITESLLLQSNDNNVATLNKLTEMGFQLSIDDFGTGYSSLSYLQRFPVHALKIDQSFVHGIGESTSNTTLVRAVIAMAHSLNLDVLAEGVETSQQASFLQSHGCLSAQGFYYSAPVPAEQFTELLHQQPLLHTVVEASQLRRQQ